MESWRAHILNRLTEAHSALILVSDPDGLLHDEGIIQGLHLLQMELVEYQDPVAFRYLFESSYRDALDQASLSLVVRTSGRDFDRFPYDLLLRGQTVSLSLTSLFPAISLSLLRGVEKEDYARLYEVQAQFQGSTEGEALDFLLGQVYGIDADGVQSKKDVWMTLYEIHEGNRGLPEKIVAYLSGKWERVLGSSAMALKELLGKPAAFYAYLQGQWEDYLSSLSRSKDALRESTLKEKGLTDPTPLFDGLIISMLDNLFTDGKLKPVRVEDAQGLPQRLRFGFETVSFGQEHLRLLERIYRLSERIASRQTYRDWLGCALLYGEIRQQALSFREGEHRDVHEALEQLQKQVDGAFRAWLMDHYHGLSNLPYLPQPVMVHHIPHFLASRVSFGRIALLVVDGMSTVQWAQIREVLSSEFRFEENGVYAWIPTITSVSRQAIFAGEMPLYFASSFGTTAREEAHWQLFWENQRIPRMDVYYQRIADYPDGVEAYPRPGGNTKVRAIVITWLDQLMHAALQGQRGLREELKLWLDTGFLSRLLSSLLAEGYQVYLTSDHGNRESVGTGRISEGILAQTRGERVRLYSSALLRDQAAARYGGIPWKSSGLPKDRHVLLAPETGAFVTPGERLISHGSLSLEEVIVPFVKVWPKG